MWLGLAPCAPSIIQDNFSMELGQSVRPLFGVSVKREFTVSLTV